MNSTKPPFDMTILYSYRDECYVLLLLIAENFGLNSRLLLA